MNISNLVSVACRKALGAIQFKKKLIKKTVKIVVVANCQARPIASLLQKLNPNIEITGIVIVHLVKNEQYDEYKAIFDDADIIISQLVAINYPCEFVRSDCLKKTYGHKVITILNLYYSGYTPDWFYIRNPMRETLRGPMGDYHNKTIYHAWYEGKTQGQAFSLVNDVDYNRSKYCVFAEQSFAELLERDKLVDVQICDYIQENMFKERLFFTFNHPTMNCLLAYVKRILEKLNIEDFTKGKDLRLNEALDQFIPVLNCGVPFNFSQKDTFKGVQVLAIAEWEIKTGKSEHHSLADLIRIFYDIYEANSTFLKSEMR